MKLLLILSFLGCAILSPASKPQVTEPELPWDSAGNGFVAYADPPMDQPALVVSEHHVARGFLFVDYKGGPVVGAIIRIYSRPDSGLAEFAMIRDYEPNNIADGISFRQQQLAGKDRIMTIHSPYMGFESSDDFCVSIGAETPFNVQQTTLADYTNELRTMFRDAEIAMRTLQAKQPLATAKDELARVAAWRIPEGFSKMPRR
ncbi:MAG: hypothetical protein IT410_04360 [Candidatus Doudnabacteria bacterium]|nr:hypothetical protein [Candidatus Doudnabacteria bacterium]